MISPAQGAPDVAITLSGCGFGPGKEVTLSASKLGTFPKLATDETGAFRFDAQVPSIGPGTFIVRASTSDTVFAETNFVIEQQGGDVQRSPTPRPSPATATC